MCEGTVAETSLDSSQMLDDQYSTAESQQFDLPASSDEQANPEGVNDFIYTFDGLLGFRLFKDFAVFYYPAVDVMFEKAPGEKSSAKFLPTA